MALMGTGEPKFLSMVGDCYDIIQYVIGAENESLAISFTMKELEYVLSDTKTNVAPGIVGSRLLYSRKSSP
jgi:hypothetical protein